MMLGPGDGDEEQDDENNKALFGRGESKNSEQPFHLPA